MADDTKGYKIYDLAKELNTNSKRIMEKLAEIKIDVKSHMSFLTEEQKDALYNHIGVIQRKSDSNDSAQDRPLPPPPKPVNKTAAVTRAPSGPRIIKKTQINLDFAERNSEKENRRAPQKSADNFTKKRNEHISLADDNSGLRAGFKRDTGYSQAPLRDRLMRNVPSKPETVEKKTAAIPGQPVNENINPSEQAKEAAAIKNEEIIKTGIAAASSAQSVQTEAAVKKGTAETSAVETSEKQEKTHKSAMPDEKNAEVSASAGTGETKQKTAAEQKEVGLKAQDLKSYSKDDEEAKTDNVTQISGGHKQEISEAADKIKSGKETNVSESSDIKPAAALSADETTGLSPQGEKLTDTKPSGLSPSGERHTGISSSGEKRSGASTWTKPTGTASTSAKPAGSSTWTKPAGTTSTWTKSAGTTSTWTKPAGTTSTWTKPTGNSTWTKPAGQSSTGTRPAGQWIDKTGRPPYRSSQDGRPGYSGQGGTGTGSRPWTPSSGTGRPMAGGSKPPFAKKPSGPSKPGFPDAPIIGKETARPDKRLRSQKDSARVETVAEKRAQIKPGSEELNKFKPQNLVLGGKTKVGEVMSEEFEFGVFYQEFGKKKRAPRRRDGLEVKSNIPKPVILTIKVPDTIILKDLAEKMKKSSGDMIKKLMSLGMMVTINQEIDFDTASILGDEFKIKVEKEIIVSDEEILFDDDTLVDKEEDLKPRAPVVVVMGHVDHGKTSLLDAIREENVIATEAGGITQHIGAYKVKINGRDITFLDTPGHEAFTSLRARGAQVTDIAILVVAADDGVMPQTIEAINHAKAANVQIIVAINKMDLPGANPERIKQQLTEYGLLSEEWGGTTIFVPISAKKKEHIDQLLEMVLLTADMLELKTNPNRQAKGTIIETQLDKNRGAIATLLVQRGTLRVGDSIVTGTTVGHVRAMLSDTGREITEAGPSTPVAILGLPEVPDAGQLFYAIKDEKVAKHLAERRKNEAKEAQYKSTVRVTLDDLYNQIKQGTVKDLNLIIKADAQGSAEALKQSLEKLANSEVKVKILHSGVGTISESDISLAEVANAIIIGFNVRPGANVKSIAEAANVDIRLYRIIYNAIEDIEAALKGMLAVKYKEVVLGHAEVRQIFKVTGVGAIAGCYVTDGRVPRSSEVRLVRDGIVIHEGKLSSLKRFKDDVKEVAQGYECGMSFEKYNDMKEGDVIEAFEMEEIKR